MARSIVREGLPDTRPSRHGDGGKRRATDATAPAPLPAVQPRAPNASLPHFVDRLGRGPAYVASAELRRLLDAIPTTATVRFSSEQMAALDIGIERSRPRPTHHPLDYRVSLPFLGRRYYFVILGGKERRSPDRLRSDGQSAMRRLWIAYALIGSLLFSTSVFVGAVTIYVVKSALGIDLFEGHSFMHHWFDR